MADGKLILRVRKELVSKARDIIRDEVGILWYVHALAYLTVRPTYKNVSAAHGLSVVEWRIIITLAGSPGVSAQEIAVIWGVEDATIRRAVRNLVKKLLLQRAHDRFERKRTNLYLSSRGMAIYVA